MKHNSEVVKRKYNRISHVYNWMDKMIKAEWRKQLLNDLHGNILEVGIGTGSNIKYYPNGIHLTGIDFSPGMLKYARREAKNVSFPIRLIEMDAQKMKFENITFDFVVATCVYCSVPNPIKGMEEMKRVCKPNGRILLLEHMRSENPILGKVMDLLNPLVVGTYGANINRRTMTNIDKAGLKVEKEEQLLGTIMRRLVLKSD